MIIKYNNNIYWLDKKKMLYQSARKLMTAHIKYETKRRGFEKIYAKKKKKKKEVGKRKGRGRAKGAEIV